MVLGFQAAVICARVCLARRFAWIGSLKSDYSAQKNQLSGCLWH
ncbi:hypothetical protein [Kingella oralis]